MIKLLAFAGSTRTDSYNKKLIKIAVNAARSAGAEVTLIDLRDYPLPVYDGDLEKNEGMPQNGRKLKELFFEHHGLMLSLPEYNRSMSGVFKNTIDWISRQEKGEEDLKALNGKIAGLMSASPGPLGGLRGLIHARAMLENINVMVIPEQVSISKAHEAFENEMLKDEKQKKSVDKLAADLVDFTKRLRESH